VSPGGRLASGIDWLSEACGRLAAALCLALVALVFALVVARYGLGLGSIAAQEATLWLHSAIFLLGMGYALRHDAHVRVDVFVHSRSPRARARIELFGIALLLWPLCAFAFWISLGYVALSWEIGEGSRDPGGLPGVYLLKTLIPLATLLLALQGLARGLRVWRTAFPERRA
jgi:TRAP-type mannitol/chloroaromatic compound transport system permease small subunit